MPTIQFERAGDTLLLLYTPDDPRWVLRSFKRKTPVTLRRTFTFDSSDLVRPNLDSLASEDEEPEDGEFAFTLGRRVDDYYRIEPRVLGTKNVFYVHTSLPLSERHFVAHRNVSILGSIDELVSQDVYLAGENPEAIPLVAFESLLDRFPNRYELNRYAQARVGASIADYLETASDTAAAYEKYMNGKLPVRSSDILEAFRSHELAKFQAIKAKLDSMLANQASSNERSWQNQILDIIRLLYPKYVAVLFGVRLPDSVVDKRRELDLLLVDASGHVDLIEIKRPSDASIVSSRAYRENYPPARELTGAVMQLEKYILHLNRWGQKGEDELNRRYANGLPSGLTIRVTNPKGMIIMGRDRDLTTGQRLDFEVIKRKYANVIDIITYDDLLARLGHIIDQLRGSP